MTHQPASKCLKCSIYSEAGGFCDHLTGPQLDILSQASRVAALKRSEHIATEELLVWPIIAVSSGVLSLQHLLEDGRKTIAALFMQGDIIDMRGIANRNRGQLIALAKTEICRLSPIAFEAVIEDNSGAHKVAWNNLRSQSYRAMDHAADLAKKQSLEKLASFIFECQRRQIVSPSPSSVTIPIRRIDLADYLGMQPETVSRVFKDLEKRGVIRSEGTASVSILDVPTLRRIANGDKHTEKLRHTDENHFTARLSG